MESAGETVDEPIGWEQGLSWKKRGSVEKRGGLGNVVDGLKAGANSV